MNITIHAGEAFGKQSIWQAIQYCGAHRIGHATRLIEDVAYDMERLNLNAIKSAFCHHDEKLHYLYKVIKLGYQTVREELLSLKVKGFIFLFLRPSGLPGLSRLAIDPMAPPHGLCLFCQTRH